MACIASLGPMREERGRGEKEKAEDYMSAKEMRVAGAKKAKIKKKKRKKDCGRPSKLVNFS